MLDMALQCNVVKKSGSWFTYEGDQLGQGRENVRQFLKDNPAITDEIEHKVKIAFGMIAPDEPKADATAQDADDAADDAAKEPSKTMDGFTAVASTKSQGSHSSRAKA